MTTVSRGRVARLAKGLLAASALAGGMGAFASAAQATGSQQGPPPGPRTPPFTQCPAIGEDSSCQFLIDVTSSNPAEPVHIFEDTSQGFYDGEDDVTVGIQNDSTAPLSKLHLGVAGSSNAIFGFDGDGLCVPKAGPIAEGCPFGTGASNADPYDYWGPDAELMAEPSSVETGVVSFPAPLQPGQFTFFSLEAPLPGISIVAGEVNDSISTELTGAKEGSVPAQALTLAAPENVTDQARIVGANSSEASGTVIYRLYSDPTCEKLVEGGESKKSVALGSAEPSAPIGHALPTNATYYWQVTYESLEKTKNSNNESPCGNETMTFGTPPSLPHPSISSTLSGGGHVGAQITVTAGTPVTDTAVIAPPAGQSVTGRLTYAVYTTTQCTSLAGQVQGAGGGLTTGSGPASNPLTLPVGTYYFQASYSGNGALAREVSQCGAEVLTVVPVPPTSPPVEKHPPLVNTKTGIVELEYEFPEPGLVEYLAEVLGRAVNSRVHAQLSALPPQSAGAGAHAARHTRAKRCKKGFVKVRRRCVSNAPVRYGQAKLTVPAAGVYKISVAPSGKVRKALEQGKTLSVTVRVTFTPANTSDHILKTATVKVHLKRKRKHGKHRKHKK